MSAATWIYLINLLDNLNGFFVFLCALTTIIFILSGIFALTKYNDLDYGFQSEKDASHEEFLKALKFLKLSLLFTVVFWFMTIFIPSEKSMYLMVGTSYLEKSNIPNKVEQVINKKLDYYLNEENLVKEAKK